MAIEDIGVLGRAARAKALLADETLTDAFASVKRAIFERIEACPIKDTETAENLRKCLKLLNDVRANLEVAVNDGKIEEFRIAEEKRRRSFNLFGVR